MYLGKEAIQDSKKYRPNIIFFINLDTFQTNNFPRNYEIKNVKIINI